MINIFFPLLDIIDFLIYIKITLKYISFIILLKKVIRIAEVIIKVVITLIITVIVVISLIPKLKIGFHSRGDKELSLY